MTSHAVVLAVLTVWLIWWMRLLFVPQATSTACFPCFIRPCGNTCLSTDACGARLTHSSGSLDKSSVYWLASVLCSICEEKNMTREKYVSFDLEFVKDDLWKRAAWILEFKILAPCWPRQNPASAPDVSQRDEQNQKTKVRITISKWSMDTACYTCVDPEWKTIDHAPCAVDSLINDTYHLWSWRSVFWDERLKRRGLMHSSQCSTVLLFVIVSVHTPRGGQWCHKRAFQRRHPVSWWWKDGSERFFCGFSSLPIRRLSLNQNSYTTDQFFFSLTNAMSCFKCP